MRRTNLFDRSDDRASERPGFTWRGSAVGSAIGAAAIGGSVYELAESELTFPFHFHHGMEEWLLVISGSPSVRTPAGESKLRAGDLRCFPVGPEGAHQVRGPGTVLILSATSTPETVEYPESGKLGATPPRKFFRVADAVDYWDGE